MLSANVSWASGRHRPANSVGLVRHSAAGGSHREGRGCRVVCSMRLGALEGRWNNRRHAGEEYNHHGSRSDRREYSLQNTSAQSVFAYLRRALQDSHLVVAGVGLLAFLDLAGVP